MLFVAPQPETESYHQARDAWQVELGAYLPDMLTGVGDRPQSLADAEAVAIEEARGVAVGWIDENIGRRPLPAQLLANGVDISVGKLVIDPAAEVIDDFLTKPATDNPLRRAGRRMLSASGLHHTFRDDLADEMIDLFEYRESRILAVLGISDPRAPVSDTSLLDAEAFARIATDKSQLGFVFDLCLSAFRRNMRRQA